MPEFYEEKELKRLQACEMQLLKDFMSICDAHGLRYFGIAGTGLGAVRHGGFIPWDDDIDIAMPRADFEKFCRIADKEYADRYYLLNPETCSHYPMTTTRWCIKGTRFVEHAFKDVKAPMGIFLDLYAFDNLADQPLLYTLQVWEAWFWSKLLILRNIREPYLGGFGNSRVIAMVCRLVYDVMGRLNVSEKWLYNKAKRACTRYNRKETERFGFPCDTSPHWNTMYKADVFPLTRLPFEDIDLSFPHDMDTMLKGYYGDDYMTPPPVEKRKTHYPYILDFGDIGTVKAGIGEAESDE